MDAKTDKEIRAHIYWARRFASFNPDPDDEDQNPHGKGVKCPFEPNECCYYTCENCDPDEA